MISKETIWQYLEDVKDPEVPVLSVVDLGIIRFVETNNDEVQIIITPTYSGCPAMDVIRMDIRLKLIEKGIRNIQITQSLSPAWTTDWISEKGKQQLKAFGIAPPHPVPQLCDTALFDEESVACPRCGSHHTEMISRFGSTACKSLYRCLDCKEAFDYFKCH